MAFDVGFDWILYNDQCCADLSKPSSKCPHIIVWCLCIEEELTIHPSPASTLLIWMSKLNETNWITCTYAIIYANTNIMHASKENGKGYQTKIIEPEWTEPNVLMKQTRMLWDKENGKRFAIDCGTLVTGAMRSPPWMSLNVVQWVTNIRIWNLIKLNRP